MFKGLLTIGFVLFCAGLSAFSAWGFSGCASRSRKEVTSAQGDSQAASAAGAAGATGANKGSSPAVKLPAPASPAMPTALGAGPGAQGVEKGKWVRLTLTSVDLDRQEGKHVITVKGKAPSAGWKAEIKPLPGTESATREFELVGLPPEGTRDQSVDTITLTRTESFDGKVEQVLVHSADGATVVPLK